MKKILSIVIAVTVAAITFAQTQQGIVKTRGRVVNGQVVPGTRLSGATVTLNFGNPLVSGNQGTFSFNVPTAKTYALVSATKQGYTLADPEFTSRSFVYSANNPFYVVLEDEAQRQADINAATRKVRKTLMLQLEKCEKEIETLKEQNKLTEQEYQERLKALYDNQSNSEQLIQEMAERYVTTDYDQLDDFNRKVQMFIEDGELQKADSMIRSKGNMEKRISEYHKVIAVNKKARKDLELSERGAAMTYEDISRDLLHKSEIFLQEFNQDSALYYLKMRADLDTTKANTSLKYGSLCFKQKKYEECEKYWHISMRAYLRDNDMPRLIAVQIKFGLLYAELKDKEQSEKYLNLALNNVEQLRSQTSDKNAYLNELGKIYNDFGILYMGISDYEKSEKFYLLALSNRETLFALNHDEKYRYSLAGTQQNLGNLYKLMHDYTNSEKFLTLSLENIELSFKQNENAYREGLCNAYRSLGSLYLTTKDYTRCEKYLEPAVKYAEELYKQNPDAYRVYIVAIYNELGYLYLAAKDHKNSLKYLTTAYQYSVDMYKQHPLLYRSALAYSQYSLGRLYYEVRNNRRCEQYLMAALKNYEPLYRLNPDMYGSEMSQVQSLLGAMYATNKDYVNSETYYKLSLQNLEDLYSRNPEVYRSRLSNGKCNLGRLYRITKNLDNSETLLKQSLVLIEKDNAKSESSRANLASVEYELGLLYVAKKDFAKCTKYIKQALSIREKLCEINPELYRKDLASTQFTLGDLYRSHRDYDISEDYYNSAIENYRILYKQNPDKYKETLAKVLNNLSKSYTDNGKLSEALKTIDGAISLMPEKTSLYGQKSKILLKQGKKAEAMALLQNTVNPDSNSEKEDQADESIENIH